MKIDLSMEGMRKAAGGLVALASHANLALDVVRATLGHSLPDTANGLAKLVSEVNHGGKNSWVDESMMFKVKQDLSASEQRILRYFDHSMQMLYGEGSLGLVMAKRYGNQYRPALLHLRIPETVLTDKIARVVSGKNVHDEVPRLVPGDDGLLLKFLKTLIREIRYHAKIKVGSPEEKLAAGHEAGRRFLKDNGMPIPELVGLTQAADTLIDAIPGAVNTAKEKVAAAVPVVKSTIGAAANTALGVGEKVATDAEAWIDQTHEDMQNQHEQGQLAGVRRWYRSLR